MISFIKSLLGFSEEKDEGITFMPKERRDEEIPKFKLRREISDQGQLYLPADKRAQDGKRPDVEPGDPLSIDVFTNETNDMYVDVTVTKANTITIPSEVRDNLEIEGGETIAVHAYFTMK